MDSHAIRQTIDALFVLLETGFGSEEDNINQLEVILDRLAWSAHCVGDTFEAGHPEPPRQPYATFRALAAQRLPSFGLYNLPIAITDKIMDTSLMVGDALDDLSDIACELAMVRWCWTHTSEQDALWHFTFGFQHHLGFHLRNLQWYIHAFKQEWS